MEVVCKLSCCIEVVVLVVSRYLSSEGWRRIIVRRQRCVCVCVCGRCYREWSGPPVIGSPRQGCVVLHLSISDPNSRHWFATSLEEGAGKRCSECVSDPDSKRWFTTSLEEGAGKRCSECVSDPNSKHWFTTSLEEGAGKRCSECVSDPYVIQHGRHVAAASWTHSARCLPTCFTRRWWE